MAKGKKDPNKPKGVKSAYIYFTESERSEREKSGKAVVFAEFSKSCGLLWGEMADSDKLPYVKLSEKDRKRYEKEMENYIPPSDDEEDEDDAPKKKKVKKIKDPNAPKKNISSYFHFAAEKRPEIKANFPGISITDTAKKIGQLWQSLEDRTPFEKLAEKDKARYEKEISLYNQSK